MNDEILYLANTLTYEGVMKQGEPEVANQRIEFQKKAK
jgi:hypothetical protein